MNCFKAIISEFIIDKNQNGKYEVRETGNERTIFRHSKHEYKFFWQVVKISHWYKLNSNREWEAVPDLDSVFGDSGYSAKKKSNVTGNVSTTKGQLRAVHGDPGYYRRDLITYLAKNYELEKVCGN